MKKNLLKLGFLLLMFSLSISGKAQTSVNITAVMDSSSNWQHCPPPVNIELLVYGTATGYNYLTDSIDLHVYWGDGTDTTMTTPVMNGGGSGDYWQTWGGFNHFYNMAGTFNVVVIATGDDGTDDTTTHPVTIYSGCVLVDGYCYNDNNNNCIFDAGDDTLSGIPIQIVDANGIIIGWAYTNNMGYYSVSVPQGLSGLTISPLINSNGIVNTVTCPVSGNYTFNSTAGTSFSFGLDCSSSGFDLFAQHSFSGVGAPGSNGVISFYAGNYSCSSTSGTVTLTLDPNVSYVNMLSGPAPSTVSGNTLTWNVNFPANGNWYNNFHASLSIYTSTSAVVFDTACFTVSVSPTSGDLNTSNNTDNWCLIIGGPYDPNNKLVWTDGIQPNGTIPPQSVMTYTVNFQNTGTAPAINIYVMDTISNNLDMSTFEIIASSHTMNPQFFNGNIVRFDFPNINLPDSNTNEPLSHGWVVYKVKAKNSLVNGDEIKNTAYIYFDYNAPIVTNTTQNTVIMILGTNSADKKEFSNSIFPNPSNSNFNVRFEKEISGTLNIYDATGKIVKSILLNHVTTTQVNVNDLPAGIYSISIPGVQLNQNRLQVIR